MSKRISLSVLLLLLAMLLTGCGLRAADNLYTLPKPTPEYESLQSALDQLLQNGYEYAAPLSGANTQPVQMVDLDGDDKDEAVAFLRDTGGNERPLKIVIFRQDDKGGYAQAAVIEGDGDAINSVVYCQLNDEPDSYGRMPQELVVGWRISGTVYALSAYSIENDNVTQLMTAPSYTLYAVRDLDQDNQAEIVSIQMSAAEDGGNTASYYDWQDGTMMYVNSVALSVSAANLDRIRYGYLQENYPALYVNSSPRDNTAYRITDILTTDAGRLKNITLDPIQGDSATGHLVSVDLKDINNDSVLELPVPIPLNSGGSDTFNAIHWMQYDKTGRAHSAGYTYHNTADGWYFDLPANWLNHLVLERKDTNTGVTVERTITFSYQANLSSEPEPFLIIYKNTGSNRETRATMSDRFLITSTSEATYSGLLLEGGWECGLDAKGVYDRFHLILTDWSND